MISYNQLITVIETFASNHLQVKRFGAEFKEQLPNISTDGVSFPYLFMTPVGTATGEFVKEIEVEIYCIDRLRKDRENTNDVVSDTEQILTDLSVWLEDGQNSVDVVRSYSATPLNNGTLDFVSGWSQRYKFELERIAECEIPIVGNINGIPCADASYVVEYADGTPIESGTIESGESATITIPNCQDATAITKDSAGNILSSTNIPSGTSQDVIISDSTVTNSLGNVLASIEAEGTEQLADVNNIDSDGSTVPTPVGVAFTCTPAEDVTFTLNTNQASLNVPSGEAINVNLKDQNGNIITPSGFTGAPYDYDIEITLPTIPIGATLMKTGMVTSNQMGDDAFNPQGRDTDFFILGGLTPLGNNRRFSDELGNTSDDTNYYDSLGNIVASGTVYLSEVFIDWSTFNGTDYLMYYFGEMAGTTRDLTDLISWASGLTILGHTDWKALNDNQLFNLKNPSRQGVTNYPPMSKKGIHGGAYGSNTSHKDTPTSHYVLVNYGGDFVQSSKTTKRYCLACRRGTPAELGL